MSSTNPSHCSEDDNKDEIITITFDFQKPCNCRATKILRASRPQLISENESLVIISQLLSQLEDNILPDGWIQEGSNLVKYIYDCIVLLPKDLHRMTVWFVMGYPRRINSDDDSDTSYVTALIAGCGWVIRGVAKQLDDSKEEQVCAVCLENLLLGNQVYYLPCKHVFHKECIDEWVDKAASCPLCRSSLSQICDNALMHLEIFSD